MHPEGVDADPFEPGTLPGLGNSDPDPPVADVGGDGSNAGERRQDRSRGSSSVVRAGDS